MPVPFKKVHFAKDPKQNPLRVTVTLFLALLLSSFVLAQSTDSKIAADKREYTAAINGPDAQARITALRQFTAKYPKSSKVDSANDKILDLLIENFPTHTTEINEQVQLIRKGVKGDFAMYDYNSLAETLADGNVLLPLAERLSENSLSLLNEQAYTEATRKSYEEAKMKVPPAATLHRYYLYAHSAFQATLGRIYFKQGKTEAGERLLKTAIAADASNVKAAASLGEIAAQQGQLGQAIQYLTTARLAGSLRPVQEKLLENLFAREHNGSLAYFDQYLDERYAALFPAPFEPTPYKPSDKSPTRTVLAELFTGAGCPPCTGADLAMDGVLKRYSRQELAVLMFHEHRPHPDPLANPDSVSRFEFYNAMGVPTIAVDGQTKIVGTDRDGAQERFHEISLMVDKELQTPAEGTLTLTAQRKGDLVECHISAKDMQSSSKDLKLQVVVVEDEQRYSGENGIRFHPMVVRDVAAEGKGFPVDKGPNCDVNYTFDIAKVSANLKSYLDEYEKANDHYGPITFLEKKFAIDPANLSVVAFVQDEKTKHVLQAVYTRVD